MSMHHRRHGENHLDPEQGISRLPSKHSSVPSKHNSMSSSDHKHGDFKPMAEEHELHEMNVEPGAAMESDPSTSLHRGLKARHISMIAIGGALGTGLIIATGSALANAGPGSIFIGYLLVGLDVWLVMTALGEMAAWLPVSSNFAGYATRYVDPAFGFGVGWTYWFKYIINTPNQMVAGSLVIQSWVPREKVNPGVWIAIFLVAILAINYFGIAFFGELEFWFSSIKVLVILGIIILSVILAAGGGPKHHATGFEYWQKPGAFKPYEGVKDPNTAKFVAFWSTLVTATYAYLGTELIGITVGEAQNPRKTIPRAIKLTFFRIMVFYVVSVFLLGMLVPYNSKELAFAKKASTSADASPFVVAIKLAGIPVLPGFVNGCILLFVFSASNSDLYIASRTIFGLAKQGKAPAFLAVTDRRGVPVAALGISGVFALLAFMSCSTDSRQVFTYFVNLVTVFGQLTWITILLTHIRFVAARRRQGIADSVMPYRAPLGVAGSWAALAFTCLMTLTKSFTAFIPTFDAKTFITGYIGIPLYVILIVGYKLALHTRWIRSDEADLFTGKHECDREEAEFLENKQARAEERTGSKKFWYTVYEKGFGWLF